MSLLSGEHSERTVMTHSASRVAYTVGAMSGWATAMDDAEKGAPHPPAFGRTELMLPAPNPRKVYPDRTASFNQALDAIQSQSDPMRHDGGMGPPAPRRPKRKAQAGYFDDAERRMPHRRRGDDDGDYSRDAWDDWDGESSHDGRSSHGGQSSKHTSAYTMNWTFHAQDRAKQREILRRDLQKCVKYGWDSAVRTRDGRWQFFFNGITLITDSTGRKAITAVRGTTNPHSGGGGGGQVKLVPSPLVSVDEVMSGGFDLDERQDLLPPPTPRSELSSPRNSVSRSRSMSMSRDGYEGRGGYGGGASSSSSALVPIREQIDISDNSRGGAPREYGQDDPSDVIATIRARSRVINDVASGGGRRVKGLLWTCPECEQADNVAWLKCISCGANYPEAEIRQQKATTRQVLDKPEDLATAERQNPHRLGTMAGYACGRYKAVVEDLAQTSHPAAFEAVALMPPPPPKEQCSLPDQRMLGLQIAYGEAPWPDEA